MAGANRTSTHTVEQEKLLERLARQSHPFQVMRRLENLFSDYPRFGTSPLPAEDPVRLRQTPYMGFAPSFISSFKGRQGDQRPVLSVYGFGLFGANGPLPLHLTEYTRYRMREGDAPKNLSVKVHAASAGARKKIEEAGGSVEEA